MFRYGVAALAAIILVFSAGAFAHFAYPGPASPTIQIAPTVQPYIAPCDKLREETLTQAKERGLALTGPVGLDFLRCGGSQSCDCPDCNCDCNCGEW